MIKEKLKSLFTMHNICLFNSGFIMIVGLTNIFPPYSGTVKIRCIGMGLWMLIYAINEILNIYQRRDATKIIDSYREICHRAVSVISYLESKIQELESPKVEK